MKAWLVDEDGESDFVCVERLLLLGMIHSAVNFPR